MHFLLAPPQLPQQFRVPIPDRADLLLECLTFQELGIDQSFPLRPIALDGGKGFAFVLLADLCMLAGDSAPDAFDAGIETSGADAAFLGPAIVLALFEL